MLPKNSHTPDFLFRATVIAEGRRRFRMLCAIVLPKNTEERIRLDFYPSVEQALRMRPWRVVSVSGRSVFGDTIYKFHAKEVWCTVIVTGNSHDISYVTNFEGNPTELRIEMLLDGKHGKYVGRGTFNLTDCPVMNVGSIMMRSYTGNVRVRGTLAPRFKLHQNVEIRFRNHFQSSERNQGETITRSHLVAECKITKPQLPTSDFANIEGDLSTFLLLGVGGGSI